MHHQRILIRILSLDSSQNNSLIVFFRCSRFRSGFDLCGQPGVDDGLLLAVLDRVLSGNAQQLQEHGPLGVLLQGVHISLLPVPANLWWLPQYFQWGKWKRQSYVLPECYTRFVSLTISFIQEYYVIREWLVPGWLMVVQAFVTLAFILTFFSLVLMSLEIVRWPLKGVLQYEWIMTRIACICTGISCRMSTFFSEFVFLSFSISSGVPVSGRHGIRCQRLQTWLVDVSEIQCSLLGLFPGGSCLYDSRIGWFRSTSGR